MFKALFYLLSSNPNLQKGFWKTTYNLMARNYSTGSWRFMNYGYAPVENPIFADLNTEYTEERFPAQLYHRTVEGGEFIRGKSILEVGCGRGGGSAFLHRQFGCSNTTGLDIARNSIDFCRKHFQADHLEYVTGSADALPFEDESFDAVITVESSHTYPDIPAFLSEVCRVLKSEGRFFFVDFRRSENIPPLEAAFADSGLTITKRENITEAVVNALKLDNENKEARISSFVGPLVRPLFREFAGMENSTIYEGFASGRNQYWAYVAEKTF